RAVYYWFRWTTSEQRFELSARFQLHQRLVMCALVRFLRPPLRPERDRHRQARELFQRRNVVCLQLATMQPTQERDEREMIVRVALVIAHATPVTEIAKIHRLRVIQLRQLVRVDRSRAEQVVLHEAEVRRVVIDAERDLHLLRTVNTRN